MSKKVLLKAKENPALCALLKVALKHIAEKGDAEEELSHKEYTDCHAWTTQA